MKKTAFLALLWFIPCSIYSQCKVSPQQAMSLETAMLITTKIINGMKLMNDDRYRLDERKLQAQGIVEGYLMPDRKDKEVIFNDLAPMQYAKTEPQNLKFNSYLANLSLYQTTTAVNPINDWYYLLGKTVENQDWVDIYINKTVNFIHPKYSKGQQTNIIGIRYLLDNTPNHTPKLAGISRVAVVPENAFTITQTQLQECKNKGLNLETACNSLVNEVISQYKNRLSQKPVQLYKFSYGNSGYTNQLSDLMTDYVKKALENAQLTQQISTKNENSDATVIKGYFSKSLEKLKMSLVLISPKNKDSVTVSIDELSIKWLNDNNIPYIPSDFESAVQVQKTLNNGALPNADANFSLQIRTDRGREGIEIREKEILRVYVKASKPCYIRLVDLLPDGSKVMLADNLQINADQVNQDVVFPDVFECSAPFGQEYIMAFAADRPFEKLSVIEKEGYKFIQGPLNNVLATIRGFKSKAKVVEDKIQIISRNQ